MTDNDSKLLQRAAKAMRAGKPTEDVNALGLIKGKETYFFLYDDTQRAECLRHFRHFAQRAELSFSFYDAAVLSQKIRQEERRGRNRIAAIDGGAGI